MWETCTVSLVQKEEAKDWTYFSICQEQAESSLNYEEQFIFNPVITMNIDI